MEQMVTIKNKENIDKTQKIKNERLAIIENAKNSNISKEMIKTYLLPIKNTKKMKCMLKALKTKSDIKIQMIDDPFIGGDLSNEILNTREDVLEAIGLDAYRSIHITTAKQIAIGCKHNLDSADIIRYATSGIDPKRLVIVRTRLEEGLPRDTVFSSIYDDFYRLVIVEPDYRYMKNPSKFHINLYCHFVHTATWDGVSDHLDTVKTFVRHELSRTESFIKYKFDVDDFYIRSIKYNRVSKIAIFDLAPKNPSKYALRRSSSMFRQED